MQRLAFLLAALVLAGCGGVDAAKLPPSGTIWFGETFDPETFEVTRPIVMAAPGTTVVLVAKMTHPITSGQATLVVAVDGAEALRQTIDVGPGEGDVFGASYGLGTAGQYRFTIVDVGGNSISVGELTVE